MEKLRALWMRLAGLVQRRGDEDLAAELESHVAMHTEDGIHAGLDPAEARRQALIRLGGVEQTRQAYRERRTLPWLENLLRDVGYALRQLRKARGYALTAVLTLALAIGANTATFSLVHATLLRQLPFDDPSRVLNVENAYTVGLNHDFSASTPASFDAAARSFKTIERAAIYSSSSVSASLDAGPARRIKASETSAQFLEVLGVTPRLGRGFAPDQDVPGKDQIVLISDRLWRGALDANPSVLGRAIKINGLDFTIIGVLPPGMDFPANTDLWTPTNFDTHSALREAGAFFSFVLVRARANVSLDAVRAEFSSRSEANRQKDSGHGAASSRDIQPILTPIAAELTKSVRSSLLMLGAAVFMVLLIACVNIASLTLVRTAERRSEFAVRAALGAARGRLVGQQLVETTLIAVTGGALGVSFAYGLLQLLFVFRPAALNDFQRPGIDPLVLAFTAAIALATGLAFGIAPAWVAGHEDPAAALKNGVGWTSARGTRSRKLLVTCEIGVAFVLLTGAGLLLRTTVNMDRVPLGYDIDGRLSFSLSLYGEPYVSKETSTAAVAAFYSNVLARLAGIPGVTAVGAVSSLPLDKQTDMLLPVTAGSADREPVAAAPRIASSGYFGAMGIPLVEGRDFSKGDSRSSPRVAIVTKDLADKLWPGESPIGHMLHCFWFCKDPLTVVGVVYASRRFGPRSDAATEFYVPFSQQDSRSMTVVLRSNEESATLIPSVRHAVAAVDPAQPIYNIETMRERFNDNESLLRFELFTLSVFAVLSVLLAVIGLYGVVSYAATQRTHEIGIRIALGAPRAAILIDVLRQSAFITLAGTAIGLTLAVALTRLLTATLFGVSPHDPKTLGVVSLLFLVLGLLASYFPARRAASIDPMQALRTE
jgi:predicted permease